MHISSQVKWALTVIVSAQLAFVGLQKYSQAETSRKHHKPGGGFQNVDQSYEAPDFADFLVWQWDRLWNKNQNESATELDSVATDTQFLKTNQKQPTVTWIGHATLLVQMDGLNILTDPHFSERASPVQWAGPKRLNPPGIILDELPVIDVVLISHDHYDSLDVGSIKALVSRQGGEDTRFFVPLGLKKWFSRLNVSNVVELDWWQQVQWKGVNVVATPAQHWSKRGLLGRNQTLWASWVIFSEDFRFYFAGDSGYAPLFKKIGDRFGPFDLAAIPIGAYEPRWFMRAHHMNPSEAVNVHRDVQSKKSVAIHWGTFILTDEPVTEPPQKLSTAIKKAGLDESEFVVLKHGQTLTIK